MAQHSLRAEIQFREKIPLGCTFINVNNFFVCGPKYTRFFSPNVRGVADDQELFRFLICWSVPEISDQSRKLSKIAKNFGRFFGCHKFLGAGIVKLVHNLSHLRCGASTEKSPVRILPLARKLLSLTRWILGQIFNFHDWNFFRGDRRPSWGVH